MQPTFDLPRLTAYAPYDGWSITETDRQQAASSGEVVVGPDGLKFTILTDWDHGSAGDYGLTFIFDDYVVEQLMAYPGKPFTHLSRFEILDEVSLDRDRVEIDVEVWLDGIMVGKEVLVAVRNGAAP
jgi:hypothetical protein